MAARFVFAVTEVSDCFSCPGYDKYCCKTDESQNTSDINLHRVPPFWLQPGDSCGLLV